MRRFASSYPNIDFAKQAVSQLPWGHLIRLMQMIESDATEENGLTIQGKAHERAIENGLIAHIRDFLLELGQGFAFVGSQVPLTFDDQEFFIDLLFYHLNLRSFIVVELKAKNLANARVLNIFYLWLFRLVTTILGSISQGDFSN